MSGRLILIASSWKSQLDFSDLDSISMYSVLDSQPSEEIMRIIDSSEPSDRLILCYSYALFDSRQPHNSKLIAKAREVILGALDRGVNLVLVADKLIFIHKYLRIRADDTIEVLKGQKKVSAILDNLFEEYRKERVVS